MKKIENENKMRNMNVSIKKEILALILMMMIENQRVINLSYLHN